MVKLIPYAKYKDSNVPWLGDVPEHWQQHPGRACFVEKKIPNADLIENTVLSLSYGKIVVKPPAKLHGLVPASFKTYQIINPDDIIIRPTDLQNDWNSLRFGLASYRGIITSAYMCFQTVNNVMPQFGYLLLHTYDLKKVFYGLGSGLRQSLNWSDFKYLPCPIPPIPEQTAIVRYLDYVERRVRQFVRAKQKLIGLLEEQKQVIVHRAVTRGLDPDVPLKPSGVEWLGDVPEHWDVRRLRNLVEMRVSNVDKHVKGGETPVRLCNYVDVYKNDYISEQMNFMRATATPEEIERFRLEKDDVIITKDSEVWDDIGVPALVIDPATDIISGYHLALLRPYPDKLTGDYLLRALQSKGLTYQFHIEAKGVTRYGLSQSGIKSAWIPFPPLPEQTAIVEYLDKATADIDAAITRARREIELLNEYRTRLIADVVTGKLDVREAAAQLPAECDASEPLDNGGFTKGNVDTTDKFGAETRETEA